MRQRIGFYLMDILYKVHEGRAAIYLFGRKDTGEKICCIDRDFEPYFYVIPKPDCDIDNRLSHLRLDGKKDEEIFVTRIEHVRKTLSGQEVDAIRVCCNLPSSVPKIKDEVKAWRKVAGVHEYDVLFVWKYLIDKQLIPTQACEAVAEPCDILMDVPVFEIDSIKPGEGFYDEPKVLAIDIETYNPTRDVDPEKNPILMVSLAGKTYRKVLTWKRFQTKNKDILFLEDEATMLTRLAQIIKEEQPDILTGYFSDGFDLPYIAARCRKLKVKDHMSVDGTPIRLERRGQGSAGLNGIVHLDLLGFIRYIIGRNLDTDSYSLDAVSKELLGEGKHDVDIGSMAYVWDESPKDLDVFCEYNLQDSVLTYRLCQKILPNILELSRLIGVPLFDASRMAFSSLVEWFLLRNAPTFGQIAPNKPGNDEIRERRMQTFVGAFVYEPKPGLYKDIIVYDFRSLYPSIIASHNISPETLDCTCCQKEGYEVPDENHHHFCRKRQGFVSSMIEVLIRRRAEVKALLKKAPSDPMLRARSDGLKLMANSFYGYLGFYAARWYSLESAKSVTAWGRHYIHSVIDRAEQTGFKVIYSDTDSVFLTLDGKSEEDAARFVAQVNKDLPGVMELEYEALYSSGIFVGAKLSEAGAKKKYALMRSDGTLKIRGFETVRRNWSNIAKETQKRVLSMVLLELDAKHALQFVRDVVAELKSGRAGMDRLVIITQIQKDISDYAAKGPHIRVAMRMKDKGLPVTPGTFIRYVIVKGKGSIGDRALMPEDVNAGDYDADYYVDHQVLPAVESLFDVFGMSRDQLVSDSKQKNLSSFFG